MSVLVALAAIVFIPIRAANGNGHRGEYIAAGFLAAVFAYTINLISGPPMTANPTPAEIEGAAFITEYGASAIVVLMGVIVGSILGACLFRPRATRKTAIVTKETP